jgi:hypothetical protein
MAAHCSFDEAVRAYFNGAQALDVLESNPETRGGSWVAGGCAMAARAIESVLVGSELWAIGDLCDGPRGVEHHFVVRFGPLFVDGEGAVSEDVVLSRWRDREGLIRPELRACDTEILMESGVPCGFERNFDHSVVLARGLAAHLEDCGWGHVVRSELARAAV